MKTETHCPPAEELRHLVDGTLTGEREQEYTSHLDSCTCCQKKLEEIATSGSNLSQVIEKLNEAEPEATAAYWTAVRSLEADSGEAPASDGSGPPRRREASLDFLLPAIDAAYLGRLAHFDVMRILGRGGMGIVLEAFDSKLQRNVALKVLDPELAGDDVAGKRFCREARAAASITHENVVAVHQVERASDGKLPYLVMQLISGESLEQRLARVKQLPLREIVRIGMQAAHGLAAAHAQGLIHRDIKPGNILLEANSDRVKLSDFGLARAAEDVKLTRTGFVSGTPLYMAPEQAMGEAADHRSDLFSLGAILYEMCAGRPPFTGNSALAILKQISDQPHQPLRELNPDIPGWLEWTINRLLAKKPAERIQSAAELAELLEFEWALLKTNSDDVPTVCEAEERRQTRRNRFIAAAIGAGFLALGLIVGRFFTHHTNSASTNAPAAQAVSSAEPVAVLGPNSGVIWSVAFDPQSQTTAMAVEDGSVRIWDLPEKSVKATLNAHRGTVWSTQYSPDGTLLATGGDDGLIKIWKAGQSEPQQTYKHMNAVRGLTFSPDGKHLIAGDREGTLQIWALDSTKPVASFRQPGTIQAVAVSPDGETLATGGSDRVVRLWNAKTLAQKLPLEGHSGPVYGLSFHRNGGRLASVGWDKTVRIWDTRSGELVKSWNGHGDDIWGVAYSPDGKKLATGGHDGSVNLWNPETGESIVTFLGHKTAIHTVAFNRDGNLLASGGRDGTVRVWKIE